MTEGRNNPRDVGVDSDKLVMKRRDCLKACIVVMAGMAVSPLQSSQLRVAGQKIKRQLRFNLTLTNPKAFELVNQTLWFYLPATNTTTQQLKSIKVSAPYAQSTDTLGHSILTLVFPRFAPLAIKAISVVVNVELEPKPASSILEKPEAWLKPERYIETADPTIQALAAKLKSQNLSDTALNIYNWLKENLHFTGYLADDRGALNALKMLQGDCTEYAYLAVALARANGIPARMVGGYVTDKNTTLQATDYHNWAELYFEGAWHLLDAQKEHWLAPAEQYVAFRFYSDEKINPIGSAHRYNQSGDLEISF